MGKVSHTNKNNITKENITKENITKENIPKGKKGNVLQEIEGLNIEIKRSARKTICIQVKRDGSVSVLAPKRAKNEAIEQFVLSKKDWLLSATEKVQNRIKIKPSITEGAIIQFMGRQIRVSKLDHTSNESYRLENNQLLLNQIDGYAFESALKHHFASHINERILYYSNLIGVKPTKVAIKAQKSRWGSCNSKGELTFNWRLVFASESVIDYVIVHELCHMIHMNHSKEFWDTVKAIIPDFKTKREWLKTEGGFIDWSFND